MGCFSSKQAPSPPPPPSPALNSRIKSKSAHPPFDSVPEVRPPPPPPALSSRSKSRSPHSPSEPEIPSPPPPPALNSRSKSKSAHLPSDSIPEVRPPPPPPALSSRSKSRSPHSPSEPEIPSPPPPPALNSRSKSKSAHPPSDSVPEVRPPPPPPALSSRSKSRSPHPPSEPEIPPPPPPPALNSRSKSRSAHPPSDSVPEVRPPPPPLALSSRSKSRSADPPSEPGIPPPPPPPALNSRSKSRSAHPPSDSAPEVRLPPPPPALSSRSKSRSPHPPSEPEMPSPPPPPALNGRSKSKSAQNGDRGEFTSTVRSVLPDNFRFRILVVGKSGSGKSSLINTIFKVDSTAASGNADINVGFPYPDNDRLTVHEFPGFEPRSANSLSAVQKFITDRTDPNSSPSDKLHAIWICVPRTDVINANFRVWIENILDKSEVPVVLVPTKFDEIVTRGQEQASVIVQAEESFRDLTHKYPRNVLPGIVSANQGFGDLTSKLFGMTHSLVVEDSRNATAFSTSYEAQGGKPQNPPVSLALSIAQRVSGEVSRQASIVVGQSRYWRSLRSSREFARRTLEHCVGIIHTDVVDVWNLRNQNKYLSSGEFKAQMSHLVKDLAEPLASAAPSSNLHGAVVPGSDTPVAQWVKNSYQHSTENICCIMGYIVDLSVIQDELFQFGRDVSAGDVQLVMDNHDKSGRRSEIHRKVRRFVTETAEASYVKNNQLADQRFLQKTIELINEYCSNS